MLVNIFCEMDDFCKFLEKETGLKIIGSTKKVGRKSKLIWSEILTIIVFYQYSGYKTFKHYYNNHVKVYMKNDFNELVSYNRFVELMQQASLPLMLYFKIKGSGKCTGISIIDSMKLVVCHIKREHSHKVFKGVAAKGKSSTGWFFGFKIHFIINNFGEIINVHFTSGNVADNNSKVADFVTKDILGKLVGDKGYIGLFKQLHEKGIQLIHKNRSNMKNKLIDMFDKWLLKKRGLIESVGNILKNTFNLEHTRHRSIANFVTNLFSSLVAYHLKQKKPYFTPVGLLS